MSQAISQPISTRATTEGAQHVELLRITSRTFGDAQQSAVSARDLHGYLGVRRDFTTWITDRIVEYGFSEGSDFVRTLLPNFGEKGRGRSKHDYVVTLDMAKELAMVERNERGRAARQYFIACEKRLRERQPVASDPWEALEDPDTLRVMLLRLTERLLLGDDLMRLTREAMPAGHPALYTLDQVVGHTGMELSRLWDAMACLGWVSRGYRRSATGMPAMQIATEAGLASGAVRYIATEKGIRVAVTHDGLVRLQGTYPRV